MMDFKDTSFQRKLTINCRGRLIDFSTPMIMGILNLTPDSFYDGNKYTRPDKMMEHIRNMLCQGAGIIDVGAYSSRPGAEHISKKEELNRLCKALEIIRKDFPEILISVDTFRSNIAEKVVTDFHVDIINDISAGKSDASMYDTIAKLNVPYIIMHMKGTPKNMQENTGYKNLVEDIIRYFLTVIDELHQYGINDIVIDPGIGFSKTIEQNYQLLSALPVFDIFKLPVLIGVSRKSLIYKYLHITPEESLNGSTVLHTIALLHHANILRVHDVYEAKQAVEIVKKYQLEARNIE